MAREDRRAQHLFIETDGQIYLVRDRGRWRFPRPSESLPFDVEPGRMMDFGSEIVLRVRPKLSHHPEDWFPRDELFSRTDVDPLVTKAVYMTMGRLVAEVLVVRDGKVLMEKASRGFSKGYWNLPGGFLEFGETPEEAARRETEEELGVSVRLEGLLGSYTSGFPGKPTFTYGFVYRGTLRGTSFRPKRDEVEAVDWLPPWTGLERTRNPFAKWAIADAYRHGFLPEIPVRRHRRPGKALEGSVIFLDRDGTINRDRENAVRTSEEFAFASGAKGALRGLQRMGYRLAVVSNQDAVAWGWVTEAALRAIHEKMLQGLAKAGVRVENVYYCPHEIKDDCPCRKPRPGMLLAACKDLRVSPRDAWMVGDRVDDVRAGRAIGARTALLADERERDRHGTDVRDAAPDLVVPNLLAFKEALRLRSLAPPGSLVPA